MQVYVPNKQDNVDHKLAEFLNNYPERNKLRIMFLRESEGVYRFGTKRIAIKCENNNIKIRVGGGYLSIEEFIDQYTPIEFEKLSKTDNLKKFNEKFLLSKAVLSNSPRELSQTKKKI